MSTSQNQWSSPCQVLSIHPENENAVYQLFGNDVIFSPSRVLVRDYIGYSRHCKQSITACFFTINVLLTMTLF